MPSLFDETMREIEQAITCPATRAKVRALLLQHEGGRLRINSRGIARREQVKAAIHMLKERMPRHEIRDAIMQRFGISRECAYSRIASALNDMKPEKT